MTFKLLTTILVIAALAMPLSLAAQDDAAQTKRAQRHHHKLIEMGTLGGPNSFVLTVSTKSTEWSAPAPSTIGAQWLATACSRMANTHGFVVIPYEDGGTCRDAVRGTTSPPAAPPFTSVLTPAPEGRPTPGF